MNQSEELRMTYSGIITKKGQKIVHVFLNVEKIMQKEVYPPVKLKNLLDSRQQS